MAKWLERLPCLNRHSLCNRRYSILATGYSAVRISSLAGSWISRFSLSSSSDPGVISAVSPKCLNPQWFVAHGEFSITCQRRVLCADNYMAMSSRPYHSLHGRMVYMAAVYRADQPSFDRWSRTRSLRILPSTVCLGAQLGRFHHCAHLLHGVRARFCHGFHDRRVHFRFAGARGGILRSQFRRARRGLTDQTASARPIKKATKQSRNTEWLRLAP